MGRKKTSVRISASEPARMIGAAPSFARGAVLRKVVVVLILIAILLGIIVVSF
jgi:hypothetical protein